jgi:hypothetical protein
MMEQATTGRGRIAVLGILGLALCVLLVTALGGSAEAKKKKHKSASVFQQSVVVNTAVPNVPAAPGPSTAVRSTITVPKKFKGKVVGDVNVLGIQTTGSGAGAANDLMMKLTAPNGRTTYLVASNNAGNGIGDVSIGPLTLDADSPISICDQANPANCTDPAQKLDRPFAGTANEQGVGTAGMGGLPIFRGVPMRGNWTFTIFDGAGPATTSVFNGWGLQITPAKPVT